MRRIPMAPEATSWSTTPTKPSCTESWPDVSAADAVLIWVRCGSPFGPPPLCLKLFATIWPFQVPRSGSTPDLVRVSRGGLRLLLETEPWVLQQPRGCLGAHRDGCARAYRDRLALGDEVGVAALVRDDHRQALA